MKILLLDIETTPMKVYTWGLWDQNIGINQIIEHTEMMCFGDATMVTVTAGNALVAVKAHKEFRTEIGSEVAISVPEASCHLFDSQTGERLEG